MSYPAHITHLRRLAKPVGFFAAAVLATALVVSLQRETTNSASHATTAPAATAPDASHPSPAPSAADRQRQRPARQTAAARSPYGAVLDGAVQLASIDQPTAKGFRRLTVHRTSFKHPLIRVVEEFENGADTPARGYAMVADLVLVRLQDGDSRRLGAFLHQHPETSVKETLATNEHVLLQIPDGTSPTSFDRWQRELQAAGIRAAEPDYLYHLSTLPNDTDFTQLWGLNNTGQNSGTADADIDAPEAWNITTGSNSVVVAVLDVGVDYNHPDLAPNIWSHPTTGKHGYDYSDNDDDPMDNSAASAQAHGHGTHISGTIAGVGNNATGVTGVCWNAKIMAMKVGDAAGSMDSAAAVSAMRYASDNGAKAMNCSWGGGGGSPGDSMDVEIGYARDHGVIVCCAAGNGGFDGTGDNNDATPEYPANYPKDNIISVAASDRNDNLTSFSNYGATTVHLAAPGKEIRSTIPNNQYTSHDGTSMATPHVVGAVALVWAADPTLTYSQVRTRLLSKADQKPAYSGKVSSGGRLNVFKAIEDLAGPLLTLSRKNAVTTGGNGDAYPNPGESVRLDLTLLNSGSEAANGCTIAASLSAGAPATLNQSSLSVGDLAAHASSVQDNAFVLTLGTPATLPATFTVTFTLATPSKPGTTWTETAQVTIYESATLGGLVTRAGTGAPLAGATVAVRGAATLDLTTGADGRYTAPAVAGAYQITARATGLVDSETASVNLGASSGDVNFALGTASLALAPTTINVTVPPNQTRNLTATTAHTGDTPRAISFQTAITGTGLAVDKLYGVDLEAAFQGGAVKVCEINPNTGAKTSTHEYTGFGQEEFIMGAACCQDKIWFLSVEWGPSGNAMKLRSLDPATWTLGSAVTLTPSGDVQFYGLSATENKLLMSGRDNANFGFNLYQYTPGTGVFGTVGALPQTAKGAIAYSPSRASIFVVGFSETGPGEVVKELNYPALTSIREWSLSDGNIQGLAYDEHQSTLFVAAAPFSGGAPSLTKRNPATGATISGFTATSGISLVAVDSAAGAGWLTTTLASSDVATAATRSIPLVVNTAGMTLGQTFTAQLNLSSPLAAAPTPVTVNLTVGTLDPGVWEGWFETRYGRAPLAADRLADPDRDGIATFIEFATGGDPDDPSPHAGRPVARMTADGRACEFTFLRRKGLPAGALAAETSTDLAHWNETAGTVATHDATFDLVTITLPLSSAPRAFVRLAAP
ncbi:MAG: S8 family serine peptidase [Verrucomicrobia bacterium]|nr:S8 family serine peptidase [Verrucomicrobiota bacterium]